MIWALLADAIFLAAFFIEVLAALSLAEHVTGMPFRLEVATLVDFYRSGLVPWLALPTRLVPATLSASYVDAVILSLPLSYLFLIGNMRRAAQPYAAQPSGHPIYPVNSPDDATRSERAIDYVFPAVVTALLSVPVALTLLPLATPVFGLLVLAFKPRWFVITLRYYANVIGVAALALILALLPR